MPIQSSFPKVADQVILFNKNIIEILSKLNDLTTTTDSSVSFKLHDEEGVLRNYSYPSFSSLKSEIDRLNNNVNSLYSVDGNGAMIQTSNKNKYKKIITVDINREPKSLNSLGLVDSFRSKVNWFFDSLVDPMLTVELDLSNQIETNVSRCLVRRYIVHFEKDVDGYTDLGLSAINSFNTLFRSNANIRMSDFLEWHKTTPGIKDPQSPHYDEDTFELEPNSLLFDGEFNVLRIQEDRLNRKLWYVLNTLEYIVTDTIEVRKLSIDDELMVNSEGTSTRYKVIEVSEAESNPRVRLERIEGYEPIPVGIRTLKIYSPVVYSNKVRVSIGYDERNIIFIKPINTDFNLVAKKWSLGSGYYSSDLRLLSDDEFNGLPMDKYYSENVKDYGMVLKDLIKKKIPNSLGGIPDAPTLNSNDFKVVQINKHLTDTSNSKEIKNKYNLQLNLKSEIKQIENAILDRNKKVNMTNFQSVSAQKKFKLETAELVDKKASKSLLLTSLNTELIQMSKKPISTVKPKFRIRGFWKIPEAVKVDGTEPQEIIQFKIRYKYLSADGSETPVEQFDVTGNTDDNDKASYSNWNNIESEVRKRIYDEETDSYFWQVESLGNSDLVNINQIDLPIQPGEKVLIQVKSVSEVGWPESPVESAWSPSMIIPFPDDKNNILNENEFILEEANRENVRLTLSNDLKSMGLDEHLSNVVIDDSGNVYDHIASRILSEKKDENGVVMSLLEYIDKLEDRLKRLEEKIEYSRGQLKVIIMRNSQEYEVDNGSETVFNVECEDYLNKFEEDGVPTGRVYENSIYVIRDFVVRIKNNASGSILGLLSDKSYLNNNVVYDEDAPQVFWVNEHDELITSDSSGKTRTQLNNQFIWSINYDSSIENSNVKLSDNMGNNFTNTNSITNVLSSTEYNLGYSETSILQFDDNNNSLLETSKWIDTSTSINSTKKLLTTIHPVVKDLENITETGYKKIKDIEPGIKNDIVIPINIYFKMNSLDQQQVGENYEYVNLNRETKTIKHIKKVKFMLENDAENRPFIFTIQFNINRNNVIAKKVNIMPINLNIK